MTARLQQLMFRRLAVPFAMVSVLTGTLLSNPVHASDDAVETWGDIIQVLLPATAGFSTFFVGDGNGNRWDRQGTKQFAWSFGFSFGTTRLGKIVVSKARPNSNNTASFPSGHTNAAFSGASFIGTRYGPKWGTLAYAGAGFVGFSRVDSNWHYADDVVAGASIALLYNWYFVTPHPSRLQMVPSMVDGAPGVQVEVGLGDQPPADKAATQALKARNGWGFNFLFGPAFMAQNVVSSKGGDQFDLNNFNKDADPVTNAAAIGEYNYKRHRFAMSYWPLESADKGMFADPVEFGGGTFPAQQEILSSWRLHDVRGAWEYGLLRNDRWDVSGGAGLLLQDLRIELKTADNTLQSAVDDLVVLPYVQASTRFAITDAVNVRVGGDFMSWEEDRMVDLVATVGYSFNEAWEWNLGYYYYAREIKTEELYNSAEFHIPMIAIRHKL